MILCKYGWKERLEERPASRGKSVAIAAARGHFDELNVVFVPGKVSWKGHVKGP